MNLYAVFHLNLMFSSIPEEQRPEVIEKCYWPLLRLAADGLPVGIELTGLTAGFVAEIDPAWIAEFRRLLDSGAVELIGSGYAQIIGPLVPATVNRANLRLGHEAYERLFGVRPRVALVNEMTYSGGLAPLYADAGYEAIIMEWNNAARFQDWPAGRERRACEVDAGMGRKLPVLWADTMFFQQLQRRVHGAIPAQDYEAFIDRRAGVGEGEYAAFYGNDAEVFAFRPGRFQTEESIGEHEWQTLAGTAQALVARGHRFLLPSQVLAAAGGREPVRLETPEQPVVVKKQRKYNANRWALSGRADLEINSRCHRLARAGGIPAERLCESWSSDYRTHITPARWTAFRERLDALGEASVPAFEPEHPPASAVTPEAVAGGFRLAEGGLQAELDAPSGLTIRTFGRIGGPPLLGAVPHGTLSNIEFGADFFSGNAVIHRPGQRLRSTLDRYDGTATITVSDCEVSCRQQYTWADVHTVVAMGGGALRLERRMELPQRAREIVRFFCFSFPPSAWDTASLYFATHNGGDQLETFPLAGRQVEHVSPVSWLTSSEFCLGMTEGLFEIGDRHQAVRFEVDRRLDWILPKVAYREFPTGETFLRVEFSAQEIDETFVPTTEPSRFHAALRISIGRPSLSPIL